MASFLFWYYVKNRTDENRWLIWILINLNSAKLFVLLLFGSFEFDFYLQDVTTSGAELIRQIKNVISLTMMLYFQNKIVTLEIITSKEGRKAFICELMVESFILISKTFLLSDNSDYNGIIVAVITVFGIICFSAISVVFSLSIYNLQSINRSIIHMEV